MRISSSSAFAYAASGRMSEQAAREYDRKIEERLARYRNTGGWLEEAVSRAEENHRYYIDSGMWDFANIVRGSNGVYVGKYDIGYLGTVNAQRNAVGLMQSVIEANPTVRELIEAGRITGYGGVENVDEWGKELDYYYQKLTDGLLSKKDAEMVARWYLTSRDSHTHYSAKERTDAAKTWRMSNRMIAHGFDPTAYGNVLTVEEAEELRKSEEEQENQD